MTIDTFPYWITGWAAIAIGIIGLLAFAFIALFFTVGQPFGTLNDICIGLTALLTAVLVLMLYPMYHAQSPLLSQAASVVAALGVIFVVIGSALAISSATGWFLSGSYMAAGYALIGLWLLGVNYAAIQAHSLPSSLIIFGFIVSAILAMGLAALPGIFQRLDPQEYTLTLINSLWWLGSLGYLIVYPIWCLWLGRVLLHK